MAIIPSCSELIEASRRERVQDEATNFISGWMNSVVFLGEFLGPFIGGYLIEYAQEHIKDFSRMPFRIVLLWQKFCPSKRSSV